MEHSSLVIKLVESLEVFEACFQLVLLHQPIHALICVSLYPSLVVKDIDLRYIEHSWPTW